MKIWGVKEAYIDFISILREVESTPVYPPQVFKAKVELLVVSCNKLLMLGARLKKETLLQEVNNIWSAIRENTAKKSFNELSYLKRQLLSSFI
tara:strand:+ start:273 stop:551 length:279 start_codon:yes stop_codon:yes gene_type:complete